MRIDKGYKAEVDELFNTDSIRTFIYIFVTMTGRTSAGFINIFE